MIPEADEQEASTPGMDKELTESEIAESQDSPSIDPGRLLSDRREQLGLNRAQVGERLGLTETAVRDLEKNHFDRFSGSVYVRGYLKNYAKVLGLDSADLMSAYDSYDEGQAAGMKSESAAERSDTDRSGWLLTLTGLMVLTAIAAVLYYIYLK